MLDRLSGSKLSYLPPPLQISSTVLKPEITDFAFVKPATDENKITPTQNVYMSKTWISRIDHSQKLEVMENSKQRGKWGGLRGIWRRSARRNNVFTNVIFTVILERVAVAQPLITDGLISTWRVAVLCDTKAIPPIRSPFACAFASKELNLIMGLEAFVRKNPLWSAQNLPAHSQNVPSELIQAVCNASNSDCNDL